MFSFSRLGRFSGFFLALQAMGTLSRRVSLAPVEARQTVCSRPCGLVGRCADVGSTEFAPRGEGGVRSVMSSLYAATAQGSVALSLLDEEAVACISADERIRSIGPHPLRQLGLSCLRSVSGRFAELHLSGHCGKDWQLALERGSAVALDRDQRSAYAE
jgi:hypothetical protein